MVVASGFWWILNTKQPSNRKLYLVGKSSTGQLKWTTIIKEMIHSSLKVTPIHLYQNMINQGQDKQTLFLSYLKEVWEGKVESGEEDELAAWNCMEEKDSARQRRVVANISNRSPFSFQLWLKSGKRMMMVIQIGMPHHHNLVNRQVNVKYVKRGITLPWFWNFWGDIVP